MELDEIAALKLDEEFKAKLGYIRPYILAINSANDAHLICLWLDKLSHFVGDRLIRNTYLLELCHQVEIGRLQTPFNKPPPDSVLLPLPSRIVWPKISKSKTRGDSSSWSDISDTSVGQSCCCPPQHIMIQRDVDNLPALLESSCIFEVPHTDCFQLQQHHKLSEKEEIALYKETFKHLPLNQQKRHKADKQFEKKISSLKDIVKQLKDQNDFLSNELIRYRKLMAIGNAHAIHDINSLTEEITALKNKLVELEKIKVLLESSHQEVITHYQTDMNSTVNRLSEHFLEAQNRNHNLEESVQTMMQRLETLEVQQNEREQHWKNKLQKEASIFQSKLADQESKYNVKLQQLECTIDSLNRELVTKSSEVLQMEFTVKEQCSKMQKEVTFIRRELEETTKFPCRQLQVKVNLLQKTVTKYQIWRKKIIEGYEHKLLCLEKQKEIEIRDVQLQMKAQKALLSTIMAEEKQMDLEHVILKLEEHYHKFLTNIEATANRRSHEDQEKIALLEIQLGNLHICKSQHLTTHHNEVSESQIYFDTVV